MVDDDFEDGDDDDSFGSRLVRPYMVTGGRTHVVHHAIPFEALISTVDNHAGGILNFERRAIVELCLSPTSVAEISARLAIPIGVARVLVDDLAGSGVVRIASTNPTTGGSDRTLLEKVLNGIRTL
jgi:hypothetical protein